MAAGVIFFARLVFGQGQNSQEGLTLTPILIEKSLNPGEVSPEAVKITNPTRNTIEFYPKVMNFRSSGEGGEPQLYPATDEETKFSLAHWVDFDPAKLAIAPDQVIEYKYEIRVPPDAEPGGHYGAILFSTEPPKVGGEASQVAISSMVGSLVLARVPGETNENGRLEDFFTGDFFLKPPVKFVTRMRNLGNIHFKPQGQIVISSWRGKKVTELKFNEKTGNVLPQSVRRFENIWSPEYKYFFEMPMGRFSADLGLVYGAKNETENRKIYFWVVPVWIIAAFAIFIILLFFFLARRKKKRRKGPPPPAARPPAGTGHPPNLPAGGQSAPAKRRRLI